MITFLENKKFRDPSLKIKKFRVISCSCSLIDMKFISKLFSEFDRDAPRNLQLNLGDSGF